jgi:Regulator of ribonuclease activity B
MGFLDRFRGRSEPMTAADADELLLRQLAGLGADLSQPRHVLHYLYFADEASATAAERHVAGAGYETTLRPPDENIAQWSLCAETNGVINSSTIDDIRALFETAASENGGEYDGWEAAAEP